MVPYPYSVYTNSFRREVERERRPESFSLKFCMYALAMSAFRRGPKITKLKLIQ